MSELSEALGKAWSTHGEPPGKYIGTVQTNGKNYHFYKDGPNYYYETDFSREMRKKEKERKRNNGGMVHKSQNYKKSGGRL